MSVFHPATSLRARLLRQAAWGTLACTIYSGQAGLALAQEADAEGAVLAPIVIEGEGEGGPATTEGTGSFSSAVTTVGGKTATPLKELPQAVSVVTRERIEQLNMTQLEDAARRTTGMLVLTNDPGRSSIFTRGFELDTVTVEGLPAPLWSIYGTQPDLVIADRVEFLRGPAGLFSGAGEISGIANIGLKKAHETFAAKGLASVGSWDNYRAEADVNVPLTEDGSARVRVVGAYQDRDNFVDYNENEVSVVYGTFGADLGPATKLDVFVWNQERESVVNSGLPVDTSSNLLDIDRSTFVGASWNRFDNEIFDALVKLEHVFAGGITASLSARYSDRDVDMAYAYGLTAVDPTIGTTNMRAFARRYREEVFSADANLLVPFEAFGQTHEFVAGIDYRDYDQETDQAVVNNIYAYDVYNPTPEAVPEPALTYSSQTATNPKQVGAYAQARLHPTDELTVVLGARETWYEDETRNVLTGTVTNEEDVNGEFTPFAGAAYEITDDVSAFVSYSEIFQPQNNVTTPITGEQYEAGFKFAFYNGALNGSLSAFRLNQTDRAVQDPVALTYYSGGEVRSQGFETELSGYLTDNIDLFAGYAFTETEYTKDPSIPSGAVYSTFTPKHNANLWVRYSFDESAGILDRAYVAAGGRAVSGFYSGSIDAPGYAVLDAQVGYDVTDKINATLSVNNVLDHDYYDRVGGNGLFNFYGPPRNVMFTIKAEL